MKHTKNIIHKVREQTLAQKTQVVQCDAWSPKCNRCTYYNKKGLWEFCVLCHIFSAVSCIQNRISLAINVFGWKDKKSKLRVKTEQSWQSKRQRNISSQRSRISVVISVHRELFQPTKRWQYRGCKPWCLLHDVVRGASKRRIVPVK